MTNYEKIQHLQNQINDLKNDIMDVEQDVKNESEYKIGELYWLYNNDGVKTKIGKVVDHDVLADKNKLYARPVFCGVDDDFNEMGNIGWYRISKTEKITKEELDSWK